MTAQEIRKKYLKYFEAKGHKVIPRANLVPNNDPTTLFTGSGMQPLIPYLLGEEHPDGDKLVNSQTCLRAQDIDEVGDNRHTTFFEMLGNWSLGDYFKEEQIPNFFNFLTKEIGLDPNRIFVSCFSGDPENNIPKDDESAKVWKDIFDELNLSSNSKDLVTEENGAKLGGEDIRISFYKDKNWWCRAGNISNMPEGEPGGPDSEVFYLFPSIQHDPKYGEKCHVNCDCGRYIELGNSVFMQYLKTKDGFKQLPKQNVDYGGGLERMTAASIDSPDVYKGSLLWPIVQELEKVSGKSYELETNNMRIIADHLRAAVFLCIDGINPSNKEQGYVMRRLIRKSLRVMLELGLEEQILESLTKIILDMYKDDFHEIEVKYDDIVQVLIKEERVFRQTLKKGIKEFNKILGAVTGEDLFKLYDTYGFPVELSLEEVNLQGLKLEDNWKTNFDHQMSEQRRRSQTATKGVFKGGLGGQTEQHKKYHTATHLMYQALREVLGDHVIQHGSNITEERLRFDFSHPSKMTDEEIQKVEEIVNREIEKDLKISFAEYPTEKATNELHALGAFGDRYGDIVKVYTMKADNEDKPFSFEICGGPHVNHSLELYEDGKKFKIVKEESSSAGIRRIKAQLV